jgi:hypothetical protein
MTPSEQRFVHAIERIDRANEGDPNEPGTLDYARRMTAWLQRLYPHASQALRLAVRAQHIRRWTFPRDRFPMTRAGYHQWRTAAARFHADEAARILREVGYDDATVARVQSLLRKEGLKSDPETQALEDCTCLTFLERDFAAFAAKHDDEKVVGIVQRTWGKMSPRGREAAVGLELPPNARQLIERALTTPTQPPTPQAPGGPEAP